MKKIMAIDLLNLSSRRMQFHEELEFNGIKTGGLFGFISLFCKYVNDHLPDYIIVCSDTPPYKRKEIFQQYKGDRKKKTEEEKQYFYQTMELVNWFISTLNIPLWRVNGYECDDLFACLVNRYKHNNKIILCSNDNDLFQLLHNNVFLQRNKDLYSIDDFRKQFPELNKFDPDIWYEVSALYGGHNGVEQLWPRLGVKTAIKIVASEYKDFPVEYEKQLRFNIELTALPFDNCVETPELFYNVPQISKSQFRDILYDKYGIQPTLSIDKTLKHLWKK